MKTEIENSNRSGAASLFSLSLSCVSPGRVSNPSELSSHRRREDPGSEDPHKVFEEGATPSPASNFGSIIVNEGLAAGLRCVEPGDLIDPIQPSAATRAYRRHFKTCQNCSDKAHCHIGAHLLMRLAHELLREGSL